MRVLLSAYACAPNEGSEPAVGWSWATQLAARGYEVVVLTRANNREVIGRELAAHPRPGLRFAYYDLPPWLRWFKQGRRGVHLYYLLWQFGAYQLAKQLVREQRFDLAHHVTFVGLRQPSFLGLLGIPFVFGPVGGGEQTPPRLKPMFPWKSRVQEMLRELANGALRWDPLMWLTFASAQVIYVTSEASRQRIPRRFRGKARVKLAIGLDMGELANAPSCAPANAGKILYCGQLVYWKGPELALRAFAAAAAQSPGLTLTFIGSGPEEPRLRRLAAELDVAKNVLWRQPVPRGEMLELYREFGCLLYPSLHDSGGLVVLEALANGLPVICLKLGGPGAMVDDSCGVAVDAEARSTLQLSGSLTQALLRLAVSGPAHSAAACGAQARARRFTWERLVSEICSQPPYPDGSPGGSPLS